MSKPRVAVIGAGLGGLCAAIKLKEAGFDDLTVLEKEGKVGGTWRDNTYPGCCCDTPVALYEFSFAPNPNWSHLFPRAKEVQQYTEDLCDKFQLRPHLKLGEEPVRATWDDAKALWKIETRGGKSYEAEAIVTALGQLNRPAIPDIPGKDGFKGAQFHSARWDHSVDLKGKRVACIGSAASAVQLIPEVAKAAGHLDIYQRTPNWCIPRNDQAITDEDKALFFTDLEVAMRLGAMNRQIIYERADHFFWQAFSWTEQGRAALTRQALNHLEAQIPNDPELRKKLTPDFPIGCKRVLIVDDFYPALLRDNVSLITDGIERIGADGVVTKDGVTHKADVIIWATGFETTGWHWSMEVIGKGGARLQDVWAEAPEAYLGVTVSGFPNMFMLYGPNTNLGHNTITFMIEQQVGYAVRALEAMREKGHAAIDVTPAAQQRFNTQLQADLARTTWADPHCMSWYKTADGRITQNWSSHTREYAKRTAQVDWADYAVR